MPRQDDRPDNYLPKELQDLQSVSYCANDSICDPKQIVFQPPEQGGNMLFVFKMHQMGFQEMQSPAADLEVFSILSLCLAFDPGGSSRDRTRTRCIHRSL